jgi:uncharacterized membrane protein
MDDHQPMPPDHQQFHHHMGYFGGGHEMVFFSLLNTLFWLAVAGLAIWLAYRWLRPRVHQPAMRSAMLGQYVSMASSSFSALEILRRRYAAGEIDGLTFEQMRERLKASYAADDEGYDGDGEGRDGPPLYE